MTATSRSLPLLALLGALTACAAGAGDTGDQREGRSWERTRSDTKAIQSAVTRYVAASNKGDIDALAALYADDAVLLPPEHAPVRGRKAIADFWRQGTDQGLAIQPIQIDVQDDLGYLVGQYTLPATGQEPADSGKYVLCLRRQPDGSWKVTADIWNSSMTGDGDDPDEGDATTDDPRAPWPVS